MFIAVVNLTRAPSGVLLAVFLARSRDGLIERLHEAPVDCLQLQQLVEPAAVHELRVAFH